MNGRTHFVYRAYAADGTCLYVGCTGNIQQRADTHRTGSDWWSDMSRVVIAGPYTKTVALRIESEQITALQPKHNRRGVPASVDPHPMVPNLTTTKAARFLGMSERRLLRLVHRGEIEGHNIGSHIQPRFVFVTSYLRGLADESRKVAAA